MWLKTFGKNAPDSQEQNKHDSHICQLAQTNWENYKSESRISETNKIFQSNQIIQWLSWVWRYSLKDSIWSQDISMVRIKCLVNTGAFSGHRTHWQICGIQDVDKGNIDVLNATLFIEWCEQDIHFSKLQTWWC